MPPNLDENITEVPFEDSVPLMLTPLVQVNNFLNENDFINVSFELLDGNFDISEISIHDEANQIPLEQNLQELLVKVTGTEDLSSVTQVKLRVISREVTLQYLHIYTPALRELILDGSIVSSMRDLGNNLKNLKILRVNRCGLTCIDGVFGFENLEELYAADNEITTLVQCAFLSNLKILDIRRNKLKRSNFNFLNLCEKIEELYLNGNDELGTDEDYKQTVQNALPRLKILNGIVLYDFRTSVQGADSRPSSSSESVNENGRNFNGFSINFPPRVC